MIRLNAWHKNKNYAKQHAVQVGKACIHTVIFEGADGVWRTNYVYERGEQRISYWTFGLCSRTGTLGYFRRSKARKT